MPVAQRVKASTPSPSCTRFSAAAEAVLSWVILAMWLAGASYFVYVFVEIFWLVLW